jgi:hypothetical protein
VAARRPPPTRKTVNRCSLGMEPELSDADLVVMLAEEPTDKQEPPLGGGEDLWADRDQQWGGESPSALRSRIERPRSAHAIDETAPPSRRLLTTTLAFVCGLLLALTVALLERGSPDTGGVPPSGQAPERVSSLPATTAQVDSTTGNTSHPAGPRPRLRRTPRPRIRARVSTSEPQAVAPVSQRRPAQTVSAEAATPSPAGEVPPPRANPGCEAPGDLGC